MLDALRLQVGRKLLGWGRQLHQFSTALDLRREHLRVLLFFHGYSLAHTIRPLVVARSLRERGYSVVLAGRGPHAVRIRREGFPVHEVETLPQDRMDQYVARGDYAYYDYEWVDRCVQSERLLIKMVGAELVIHDMKPTAAISARLEGVDEARITQAYNQPGYPEVIHLPDWFSTESGPLDQYLADHATEARPQRSFCLLADIPEFHPADQQSGGYHYVGPLLDRPSEPEHVDVLDSDWDESLPLVYLTCGSSGRPPDYLDDLVKAVKGRPFRVLITTAGRWTASEARARVVLPRNVRVADFVPGEWVLRRAQMMIGVVGIGSIYQALGCGVPVAGAAEHLDQEYHLNRIEALGLGMKLDRCDLDAPGIVATIEAMLADRAGFAERCTPFARTLQAYDGAGRVADLVDAHFASREKLYRVDSSHMVPADEFVHYLDCTTPPQLSREDISGMLQKGLRRGIPHRRESKRIYFDHLDSWNWLYDREPAFFEVDYRASDDKRRQFFARENGHVRCRSAWQRYRVTYDYRIFPQPPADYRPLEPGQRLKLFLPFPIHKPGHQVDVLLTGCSSEEMGATFVPQLGFMYGFECDVPSGSRPLEFHYACQLSVREQNDRGDGSELTGGARRGYLEVQPEVARLPEVIQFRRSLAGADHSSAVRARAIYDALIDNRRFRKTKDKSHSMLYCTASVLGGSSGHCVTMSRAFMALCRLEGIPAREVSGALVGYPHGDGGFEMKTYCEPIFGHTWVEIFLEGKGWVPVEFHSIVIGGQALTEHNVRDSAVRTLIAESTKPYQDYYFGNLDNHRLVCSNSVKQIPQTLIEDRGVPAADAGRWTAAHDLCYDCTLRVEQSESE